METMEQLRTKHAEWTINYVNAHEQVSSLLSRCWELRKGEQLPVWVLSEESQTAFDNAMNNEAIALDKLREISAKLNKLPVA